MDPRPPIEMIPNPGYFTEHKDRVIQAVWVITDLLELPTESDVPEIALRIERVNQLFTTYADSLGQEIDNNGAEKSHATVLLSRLARDLEHPDASRLARTMLQDRLELIEQSIGDETGDPRHSYAYIAALTSLIRYPDQVDYNPQINQDLYARLNRHTSIVRKGIKNERLYVPILQRFLACEDAPLQIFATTIVQEALADEDWTAGKKENLIEILLDSDILEEVRGVFPLVRDYVYKVIESHGLDGKTILSRWIDSAPNVRGRRKSKIEVQRGLPYAVSRNLSVMREIEEDQPEAGICKKLFEENNIACFGRYTPRLLIDQYKHLDDNDLPFGAVVFPQDDHNGAFYQDAVILEDLVYDLKDKYYLRIAEAGSKIDLANRLRQARRKYGDKHKISFAIIGGHGSRNTIDFGYPFNADKLRGDGIPESLRTVDLDDARALRAADYFENKPTIILSSCSTGFTDGIGRKLSEILGATVIAPDDTTNIKTIHITYDENGRPQFAVNFDSAKSNSFYKGDMTNP